MNTWVKKHDTLFNFIDKKIKLDDKNYNLISYKIAGDDADVISVRVIYHNIKIHKVVSFSKILIYLNEYDKFIRKEKIENLSKI